MEFNWLSVLSTIVSIVSAILAGIVWWAVKFNDIKHIQIAVEKIEKHVGQISSDVGTLTVQVTEVKTRCEERHTKKHVCRK
jgi:hypothetical protein